MLKTFFNQYKLYVYAALFVMYSLGLWHVASTYTEAKYIQKQLDVAEAVIETNAKNQDIKDAIAKSVAEALAKWRPANEQSNRKIENEITKDPVYRDCKSSPSVMREYQNKLDAQPE